MLVYLVVLYGQPFDNYFALTPLSLSQWVRLVLITGGANVVLWLSDGVYLLWHGER